MSSFRTSARARIPFFLCFGLFLAPGSYCIAAPLGSELLPSKKNSASRKTEEHAVPSLIADTKAIEPGKPFRLGVLFKMDPQWHIYWHTPGELGLPTEIKWNLPAGFTAGPLQWPAPTDFAAEGIVSKVYEEEVLLFASITPPPAFDTDAPAKFNAEASWLVCKTDGSCIPGNGAVSVEIPIGKAAPSEFVAIFDKYAATAAAAPQEAGTDGTKGTEGNGEASNGTRPVENPSPKESTSPKSGKSKEGPVFSFLKKKPASAQNSGALMMLLYAFLGGLILNIMPCVLPVLSIKILSFVRQANQDPRRVLRLGLFFALGVFVSFGALAAVVVILQTAGRQVGWGFQFQEPRFVIVMSAVVFAFGLSMFGVFEVELPGGAIQGVEGLQYREGPAGAFFNGVLATALATPCTAPLLGTALGFAFSQPPLIIFLFFFLIAAGLSFPYVLLSANPGWLKFVPKPGDWMDRFKQAMGFLMMATVVWLLSVLGSQIGPEGIVWTLAFLTVVAFACWLIGIGFDLSATHRKRAITGVAALVLLILGYIYFPGRHLAALETVAAESAPEAVVKTTGKIHWQPFSIDLIEKLAAENKTIFVDFTADWCTTCKVNEHGALATDAVQDAFIAHDVEAVVGDWTKPNEDIRRVLREFGRSGVPLYVIFPAGNPGEPIVLPDGVITSSMVVEALRKASGKTS